ncbi:MAG: AzlC family ABC transporter permease [Bdellovibrionota bacterium]
MGASSVRVSSFREGIIAVFPIAFGVLPIGIIFGATAIEGGLSVFQTLASSFLMIGGAAQILAVTLIKEQAATAVIVLSALMINLRHVVYSARLSELSKEHRKRTLGVLSYFLTDECFVTLNSKLSKNEKIAPGYFFGAGLTLWILWQLSTYAGAVLGKELPTWLHIGYFSDFIFLALVCQASRSKQVITGVLIACFLSALLIFIPFKLNVLIAASIAAYVCTHTRKIARSL